MQDEHVPAPNVPAPILNFDGIPFPGVVCSCAPPDTNGEVGLTQYVQIVNEGYQVFNKTTGASIFGPVAISTIWTGFGGPCEFAGDGDPVVLYDQLANRWLVSQFADNGVTVTDQCIAVSTTADATGAFNRYGFHLGDNFFDYPKLAVWPDGYYMADNVFNAAGTAFLGVQPFAFDRAKMLAGLAATFVSTGLLPGGASEDPIMPSDLDGSTLPPAGAPNSFVEFPGTVLAYKVWHMHADFVVPANTTFTLFASPAAAAYTALCPVTRNCVPQLGSTAGLDGIGDRFMFRGAYRNFGDHESFVTNYTVSSGGVAGVRWIELRNVTAGPVTVFQESTYQPDSTWRWMGSAAMDFQGNLMLGFSASDATINPQIRYAGRLVTDPINVLSQGEAHLFDGTGSQLDTVDRWGDYSDMTIDPVDDCTFWYTQEYYATTSSFNWRTRIGNFKFPGCSIGTPTPTITGTRTNTPTPTNTFTRTNTPTPTPTPPACESWSAGPDLPSAAVRSVGVFFPANGKLYVMGGRSSDASGSDFTHPFEYDPVSNSWTTKSATYADNQVNNMACGVLTDAGTPYIYCVGGSAAGQTTAASRVFRYNPVTDTLSAVAAPWPGAAGTTLPGGFTIFSNKLYILGGFNIPGGVSTNQIWEFTPGTNAWVMKAAVLPVPRSYIPTTTIGTLIYTGGGSSISGGVITDATDSFVYNPVADTIAPIASIPRATGETRAVNFNGKMWVLGGGRTAPNPSNEVDVYNPGTNTWTTGPSFNTARRNFPADTDGINRIWLAGGYAPTSPTAAMEIFSCFPTPTPTPVPPTNTPTPTVTPTPACVSPCVIAPPPAPVVVTNCAVPPVTTSSSWTQINLPGSDVVLRCALNQLAGTTGVRILAHSILVDGPGGGSVGSTGTNGTQLIAGSGSGQCNSGATVDVESSSVLATNPNGGLKITGCGDIVLNSSNINAGTDGTTVTSSGGRVCATGDTMGGHAVTVTASGDLTMHGTTVTVATPPDTIRLTSTNGSVLAGGGACLPNRFTGGSDSNMSVTASGIADLSYACVEIAQDITVTASGAGFVCATDAIINVGNAEIRNDFGQKGTITMTACGGVGRIEIGNAILVDSGKKGGGFDPARVSSLNGSLATVPVNCASTTVPTCTARPLDAANNPVSADPADRAAHNVTGVPRCDT